MNNLTTTREAFAVYNGDDRGYAIGEPLAIYPFQAAAVHSTAHRSQSGYRVIQKVNIVSFEDLNYVYEKFYSAKESLVGNIRLGVVEKTFEITEESRAVYGGRILKYIVDDSLFLKIAKDRQGSFLIRSNIPVISDGERLYVLSHEGSFKINPFTLSREMAVQNALNKLTDEEKSLLGLK
jgi:hypothetical protein